MNATVEGYVHDGIWLSDVVLDFRDNALTKRWLHGPTTDEPLGFESYFNTVTPGAGSKYKVFAERQGSVTSIVDPATNAAIAEMTYTVFGDRAEVGAPERYGFTGREHDAESGLIYMRARHFDPLLGQFVQRDPIGFAAGDMNLYAYVWNDPYNWTDPTGLGAQPLPLPPSGKPGPANTNSAPSGGGELLAIVSNNAKTTAKSVGSIGAGAIGLANRIAQLLAAISLPLLSADTPNDNGPGNAPNPDPNEDLIDETDEDDDKCKELLLDVERARQKVVTGYYEMNNDRHQLYKYHRTREDAHPDYGFWDGHQYEYRFNLQRTLKTAIAFADAEDCAVSDDARNWADKRAPTRPGAG